MSLTQKDRKVRSGNGKTPTGPGGGGEQPSYTEQMASLLKRAYGGRHSAVKVVAGAVGANERAVKNWFDGKNGPSGENLLKLVLHSDAMLVGFLAMAGKEGIVISLEVDRVIAALDAALREMRKLRLESTQP